VIGDGCSAYMRYENFLRKLETNIGSVIGVDGGIDAVRKELYRPMNPDQLPDLVLPLTVVKQGYRVVYEERAVLREMSLEDYKDEYKMRVRVSLRALWALKDMRELLSFKKCKLFAWQLWSHKLLRYLSFLFLVGLFFASLFLSSEAMFYKVVFICQCVVYLSFLISGILDKISCRLPIMHLAFYFVLFNLASAHACMKFLLKRKQITWVPRKG